MAKIEVDELAQDHSCKVPRYRMVLTVDESHDVRAIEDGVVYMESYGERDGLGGGYLVCDECGFVWSYAYEDDVPTYEYEN
jgi:hypothetical protein